MRDPWRSSVSSKWKVGVPAVALALLTTGAGACAALDDGDGRLGDDRAADGKTTSAIATVGAGGSGPVSDGGFATSTVGVGTGTGGFGTVTSVGTGIGPDGGFGGGGGPAQPVGFWQFDDCLKSSAVLVDSSGFGNTANRTTSVACVPGIEGLAVDFNAAKDTVTVADGASFAFTDHVAVAAWINPTTVSGTHSIVTQEFNGKATFSLAVHAGTVQFSVTLAGNHVVTSSAPIPANAWSHVAGSYDGHFLFLYLDGQQVGQDDFPGTLKDANGPIEIGNNAATQHFAGAIDDVWISTQPVTISDIDALSCIQRAPTFVATPAAGPPSPPDTMVDYSIVVTNNNAGFCPSSQYFFSPAPPQGFTATTSNNFSPSVAPGATATFDMEVTGGEIPVPGVYPIPFFVEDFSNFSTFLQGQVTYDLVAPSGCFVFVGKELMMTDLSIVEDPIRTTWTGPPTDPRTGAWTFATLMENLAPTPDQAPAMVQALVNTWLTDQTVGGFTVAARPSIQQQVIDPWPKTPTGALDLKQAPLRLGAIVNRLDVRNLDQGKAGEGRFVFGVNDQFGNPLQFTLIVEYNLPATTDADVMTWANRWHGLSSHPFPSEEYNAALQTLTSQFTGRNTTPGQPNGSSLAQLRTNEIALSFEWELREFHLSPATGFLQEAGVSLTPDLGLDGAPTVGDFVNQNQAAILTQIFNVPSTFEGGPFLGGSSLNPFTFWSAPNIVDNDARQLFSLNTCNGCHGQETGTAFLQIAPRFPGQEAQLSGFLTGITVPDPVSGVPRSFGDLVARKADLTSLVCTPPPATPAAKAARKALLKTGRRQVH
jgi:hypothetical protein